jgi:hypothetical protein
MEVLEQTIPNQQEETALKRSPAQLLAFLALAGALIPALFGASTAQARSAPTTAVTRTQVVTSTMHYAQVTSVTPEGAQIAITIAGGHVLKAPPRYTAG